MRLLQRCRVNFVVLRDSPIDTVDHRLGLAWQMRDAKGSLPAFDTRPRGIHDITHGYLPPEKSALATSDRPPTRPMALLRSCETRRRGLRGGTGWFCCYGMRDGLVGQFCSSTD